MSNNMLYALLKLASYVFSNLLNKCDDTLYNIKFIPLNPFDFIYLKTCPKCFFLLELEEVTYNFFKI